MCCSFPPKTFWQVVDGRTHDVDVFSCSAIPGPLMSTAVGPPANLKAELHSICIQLDVYRQDISERRGDSHANYFSLVISSPVFSDDLSSSLYLSDFVPTGRSS